MNKKVFLTSLCLAVLVVGLRHKPSGEIVFCRNDVRGLKFVQPSQTMSVSFD